ncbi:hypothetical protein OG824_31905 [Streptomyces prunicolor]|uniref:hypothetical protein n=1 Tax=Streptomyces prunicolor TaxID=67348 RepID=UPI002252CC2E|nr:hypothetical protein [Streptomyces prunicolor]MCX5239816.1 hypothetical protein [Streptomyces prunicolor]
MAALPSTLAVTCPICDAPFELPLSARPHKKVDGRLVVGLTVDSGPLKAHCDVEHQAPPADDGQPAPGEAAVATQANVIVNVTPARPDDGALASALVGRVAQQAQLHGFGTC